MTPGPDDTVADRRLALAARQKAARGPRYEAVAEALEAILGDDFVEYRPISVQESEAYPRRIAQSEGIFRRPDAVAKSVRLLTAVTRPSEIQVVCDSYATGGTGQVFGDTTLRVGQSFEGDGFTLDAVRVDLKKASGTPTGSAYVRIYEHSGAYGINSTGFGTAIATSDPRDVTEFAAIAGTLTEEEFVFSGENRIALGDGIRYVVSVEFTGSTGNEIAVSYQGAGPTHAGNFMTYASSVWTADVAKDLKFKVLTLSDAGLEQEVFYENWDASLVEETILKGDVLCVDPGNWGLVEKVTVTATEGTGTTRKFTAKFKRPHSAGVLCTSGPTPLWSNTKRHGLVIAASASALDPMTVQRVNSLLGQVERAPTTWGLVQPTTPGASTVGPFVLGSSSGSSLGAVPLAQMPVVPLDLPIFGPSLRSGSTAGGYAFALRGDHLTGATVVTIGGVAPASFTVVSDREITFTMPSLRPGPKDIVVTTPVGTTTMPDAFVAVQAALTLTSLTPGTGPSAGGTPVVIAGTGFWRAQDVRIDGVTLASWTIVSDARIDCVTDAYGGSPGAVPLDVETDTATVSTDFVFT
jgi:hypothetical protein